VIFSVDDDGSGSESMKMVENAISSEGVQAGALIFSAMLFPAAATNQSRLQQHAFQVH